MVSIAICVPCGNGWVSRSTSSALLELSAWCMCQSGIRCCVLWHEGSDVRRVRNEICSRFLQTDCDYGLLVDSDIGSGVLGFVQRALARDQVFSAAPYRKKEEAVSYNVNYLPGETIDDDGWLKVKEAGAGCMLIHRSVFEKLATPERQYQPYPNTPVAGPLFDWWSSGIGDDGQYISEDYAFCRNARAAGFDVFLDTTARLSHLGNKLYLNE